jgi:26S proteasome regulatory subunit N12
MYRGDIAECAEKSYDYLSLSDAQRILMLTSKESLLQFVASMKENGWLVEGDKVIFKVEKKVPLTIPTMKLIAQTLGYASEMERIV